VCYFSSDSYKTDYRNTKENVLDVLTQTDSDDDDCNDAGDVPEVRAKRKFT
jgi:hypothetical protein